VIAWATGSFDETIAHTMGLTTFSLFHVFFSLETSNEERTVFSSELFENPILLRTTGLSFLTIFLATTFGPLERILGTTEMTAGQWAICAVVAASIIVVAEIRKFIRRREAVDAGPVARPELASQAS
jgi:Ca2+-transporting ATPase